VRQADRGDDGARSGSALFEPSVQDHVARDPASGDRPWRLGSQGFVAVLGGPLAIAGIAWFNAQRLGLQRDAQTKIVVAGAVAFAVAIAIGAAVLGDRVAGWRLISSLTGLAAYVVIAWVQRPADRRFLMRHGDEGYESLWGPGFAAVFAGRLVEIVVVLPLMAA